MALEGYSAAKELPLSQDEASLFEFGFDLVKGAMERAGFSKEACDLVELKATAHTLTIGDDEGGLNGASHSHADGNPFYVLTISTPNALTDLAYRTNPDASPTTYSAKTQAFYLAFEIGNNASRFLQPVLTQDLGLKDPDNKLTSLPTMSMGEPYKVEMAMRCDPLLYCIALSGILDILLKKPVEPQNTATPPANMQKPPQPPKF